MKKIIYLLFVLPLLGILGSCDDDDPIVFDHELPQFELKSNAILLEVILPQGSTATDEYYIVGDFNGGMEEAVDNLEWQLEKSSGNDMKWGIYLNPSSFESGKTLADGFSFYSKKEGAERSVLNQEVTHTLTVGVGTRTNVWVDRWESYFGNVKKEFYTIFVDDQSGWDALALHYWGAIDGEGVTGTDWPGLQPAGTSTVNGVDYTYFELPKELNGKSINTIFNNNGGGKQFDAMFGFVVERDIYVQITGNSYEEVDPNVAPYNGYYVYVDNQTTWEALALYTWGDIELAGWPGIQPEGTKEVEGVSYTYFKMGEGANDKSINIIFNNNGGGKQLSDLPVTLSRDFYFRITDDGSKEVDPFATSGTAHKIYVEDNSGWALTTMHYYGPAETSWPGVSPTGTEEIGGVTYNYYEMPESLDGKGLNFILNNSGGGTQLADTYITLDRNYYFRITDSSINEISFRVYVDNQSGWPALALYGWGDVELGGGWPGLQPGGTETVNSVAYTWFELAPAATGKSVNLIFNDTVGGDGKQFDGPNVIINRDYYYQITASTATEVNNN